MAPVEAMNDSPSLSSPANRTKTVVRLRKSSDTALQARPNTPKSHAALSEVLIAFAIVSIPLTLLSAVLCTVIFSYRISVVSNTDNETEGSDACYLNFDATTLSLLASYSSTVASVVVGFVMTLAAYSISASIVSYSERGEFDELPSPYQVGLILSLRGGHIGSLWPWIKYSFFKKTRRKIGVVLQRFGWIVQIALILS